MTQRHATHPIPEGNLEPDYLGDGAYVSHDGEQVWISADREDSFHAVALDGGALQQLITYAKKIGLVR